LRNRSASSTIRRETNSSYAGNFDSGHFIVDVDGNVIGSASGTYRDGIYRGLYEGFFGDLTGFDPDCDE
jgi:hypothetical protein